MNNKHELFYQCFEVDKKERKLSKRSIKKNVIYKIWFDHLSKSTIKQDEIKEQARKFSRSQTSKVRRLLSNEDDDEPSELCRFCAKSAQLAIIKKEFPEHQRQCIRCQHSLDYAEKLFMVQN